MKATYPAVIAVRPLVPPHPFAPQGKKCGSCDIDCNGKRECPIPTGMSSVEVIRMVCGRYGKGNECEHATKGKCPSNCPHFHLTMAYNRPGIAMTDMREMEITIDSGLIGLIQCKCRQEGGCINDMVNNLLRAAIGHPDIVTMTMEVPQGFAKRHDLRDFM